MQKRSELASAANGKQRLRYTRRAKDSATHKTKLFHKHHETSPKQRYDIDSSDDVKIWMIQLAWVESSNLQRPTRLKHSTARAEAPPISINAINAINVTNPLAQPKRIHLASAKFWTSRAEAKSTHAHRSARKITRKLQLSPTAALRFLNTN